MNKSLDNFNYDDMDNADWENHLTDREVKSLDKVTTEYQEYPGFSCFDMSMNFSNFGLI